MCALALTRQGFGVHSGVASAGGTVSGMICSGCEVQGYSQRKSKTWLRACCRVVALVWGL